MTSPGTVTRRYDSAQTRSRLLEAADELFSERGFERTTVREIGTRAGVDPALIARYFGGKTELYLAALQREGRPVAPAADRLDLAGVLRRLITRGPSPTLWAVVRRHEDPAVQAAAMAVLEGRVLAAIERTATEAGLELPRLRAELVVAALIGIALSRPSGALGTLSDADEDDVVRLGAQLLGSLLRP